MDTRSESKGLLKTLPLQIAYRLANLIIEGKYVPGQRLLEAELAESYAVSRATIREALRLLEQRGLVTIMPQRGASVTLLSAKELDDLFEVRAALLSSGARLAAERCTEQDAAKLEARVQKLRRSVNQAGSYANASAELVEMVMELSGNEVLADYIRDFALRIGRYVRMGLATPARRRASVASWELLVAAIAKKNGTAAAAAHRDLALANRDAALAAFNGISKES